MKYFLPLLTLCFLILSPDAYARDKLLDIQQVKSPGGIEAWLVEDHSIPVIALKFAFKGAGAAMDSADKQGLTQLASNTMDEGAGDLDSQTFQKTLRDLSISLHFESGRDEFGGEVKTLTRNKDKAFELLKLALTQPRFDDEAVERMRAANLSRIKSSMTDPEWIAARLQNDIGFAGHPYAQNSGGTLTTIAAITPDDLRGFVKSRLGKNILHVSAAGDITPEELAAMLGSIFGTLPEVTLPPIADIMVQNPGKTYLYDKDIPQTIIEVIQPGISRTDPDFHLAQIMNFILGGSGFGSRLTEEIREKRGLTYGIYSGFYLADHVNGFTASTSTANANTGEILSLAKTEWAKMKDTPISEQELKDAKSYLIGALPLSLTSTDAIAGLLLSLKLDGLGVDYLDQRENAIRSAQAEDIQRVAKRILNENAFTTILVGKPEGITEFEKIESLPNVE